MAFMVPVMKKEFDIYKTGRSRRASECSSSASCRSRKISECRSECPSLSTSPGSDYMVGGHSTHASAIVGRGLHGGIRSASSNAMGAGASHSSHVPHAAGATSSYRSQSIPVNRNVSRALMGGSGGGGAGSSRQSARTSQSSLAQSPTKTAAAGVAVMAGSQQSKSSPAGGSHGSLNKFHQRLVDKLRKSLRKARSEDRS